MFRRTAIAAVFVAVACSSVPPSTARLELFVNYSSGGEWPRGLSVRMNTDGTLELSDGAGELRRRVSTTDAVFARIRAALEQPSFREELRAAAAPSPEWRSSGAWIRIERDEVVGLIKPPVTARHIRDVIADVDVLFEKTFGRRYEPIGVN